MAVAELRAELLARLEQAHQQAVVDARGALAVANQALATANTEAASEIMGLTAVLARDVAKANAIALGGDPTDPSVRVLAEPWTSDSWRTWTPRTGALRASLTRIGELTSSTDDTVPAVPALWPVMDGRHLVLIADSAALPAANRALSSIALRALASLAPGRVRLTLVDVAGRGGSFGPLLRLHEKLIGPKVWHEPREVLEQFARLSNHIGQVTQKALKGRFASLFEYNAQAGNLAEAYHLLIVAGAPTGLDASSLEKLESLAEGGAACGVTVLMSADHTQRWPHGKGAEGILVKHSMRFETKLRGEALVAATGRAVLDTLRFDDPPEVPVSDLVSRGLAVGAAEADTVRISLRDLLHEARFWQATSESALATPIGLHGSREDQLFQLAGGNTVAPHALIGGTTGYGKSNLLNALILGLSWHYSPEQLEFYLVDMKEGVEFWHYRELPHARVVALESDQEFALSVLDGLLREIERRGRLFKEAGGVRSFAEYRAAGHALPRVVAVIDEFQNLLAMGTPRKADAQRTLAAVLKQGRSFGVHLVLASQTLTNVDFDPGAREQIGVRVALFLKEEGSHLVLDKDNEEAKHLKRKGEAIFNNHAGLREHNERFQCALVEEADQRKVMNAISARGSSARARPRVFEFNRGATCHSNPPLLQAPTGVPGDETKIWLGEPIGLQVEHVHFGLVRQQKSHLLFVGQGEAAARTFATAIWSCRVAGAEVRLANLARAATPEHRLVGAAGKHVAGPEASRSNLSDWLSDCANAVRGRQGGTVAAAKPLVLCIFGLHFVEDELRKAGALSPGAHLREVLKRGPDVGVHVVAWSATYSSAQAILAADLSEFDGRVVLGGGDSVSAIPDPMLRDRAGARESEAVLYDHERRAIERFRWYSDIETAIAAQPVG